MMNTIKILQQGGIQFFYRPKIGHTSPHSLDDIQRFFFVLKPENALHYHLIIVGKKNLPRRKAEHYFSFVESVESSYNTIRDKLKEKKETTAYREHHETQAEVLGVGAYAIILHNRHTHLIYHLKTPQRITKLHKDFHLQRDGDYVVNVKNPLKPTPGKGLTQEHKAHYPTTLQNRFKNRNFASLNPTAFLNYPGAELLLMHNAHANLTKEKKILKNSISSINLDEMLQE